MIPHKIATFASLVVDIRIYFQVVLTVNLARASLKNTIKKSNSTSTLCPTRTNDKFNRDVLSLGRHGVTLVKEVCPILSTHVVVALLSNFQSWQAISSSIKIPDHIILYSISCV